MKTRKGKKVKAIKGNETLYFDKIKDCAKAIGVTPNQVSNVLCCLANTTNGYKIEYL